MTNLSSHLVLVDSTNTGSGPGRAVLALSPSQPPKTVWRPQVAGPIPMRGAARYAGRAAELSESPEDAPPWGRGLRVSVAERGRPLGIGLPLSSKPPSAAEATRHLVRVAERRGPRQVSVIEKCSGGGGDTVGLGQDRSFQGGLVGDEGVWAPPCG